MSINDLAAKLDVSRQALSRQIQGKMLVETAERIAAALGVELWELFVSPAELERKHMVAFFQYDGKPHTPTSVEEMLAIMDAWQHDKLHAIYRKEAFSDIRAAHPGGGRVAMLLDQLEDLL